MPDRFIGDGSTRLLLWGRAHRRSLGFARDDKKGEGGGRCKAVTVRNSPLLPYFLFFPTSSSSLLPLLPYLLFFPSFLFFPRSSAFLLPFLPVLRPVHLVRLVSYQAGGEEAVGWVEAGVGA
jgi:hypothetical protein